jgi:hypothetical protein
MARYSAGGLTGAGSTTLPIAALMAPATNGAAVLREIGVFNTTANAVALKLCRISTRGTPGSGFTNAPLDGTAGANPALATAYGTFTSTGPTIADLGYRTQLGAAIGSGCIWTFGGDGIRIPGGANTQGVGIVVENGTGYACQVYFVWDE